MNSDSSLFLDDSNPDSLSADLSIALIGPDDKSRRALADVINGCQGGEVREYSSYPASLDDLPRLLEQRYDVIIIDLDSRPEYALELVESLCAKGAATVMVYSAKADSDLLVRCMRAGAREFLTFPFAENAVAESLVRASARRPVSRPAKKASGRLLAFLGAKGGDGVTTLACNFAVSLAQESGQSTLLIDLDLPLGDAALNLGVVAEYSTINALQNVSRLDAAFLSKLLVKHTSGVSVLAAPGKFPQYDAPIEAIDKLLSIARQEFENVVIDMGSRLDLMETGLFKEGCTVYLVIQAVIAGLRNSNRLISQYFSTDVPKLEIVLNRFQPRSMGVAEDQITKALTKPANWKIPNDFAAVRRMQHTAVPLALEDSPISRLIKQMARCAAGLPPVQEKSSGFSLKKIRSSITSKISTQEETPTFTQLDLSPVRESGVAPPPVSAPEPVIAISSKPASEPEPEPEAESRPLLTASTAESPDETSQAEAREDAAQASAAPEPVSEPQTRTYMGAVYVRGEDGRWHLKQPEAGAADEGAPAAEKEKQAPEIEWATPDPIVYGTALSETQLNAVAPVPGAFVYSPAAGELLDAGSHTLSAIFTPKDTEAHETAESTVELIVNQAIPAITWPAPAQIAYGTVLSSAQLNATASVPGKFEYKPAAGEVIKPGVQTLTMEFTPEDAENYATVQATASLMVTLSTPEIAWSTPAPIAHGTALSSAQLNATASVPGRFVYTPAAGEVLPAGEHTISVSFTPDDAKLYRTAGAAISLTVTKATPIVTWPVPAAIPYGAALGTAQLNARARIPGTFIYAPSLDEVLPAGNHTLQVTFVPSDAQNYTSVQASVPLTVTAAAAAARWTEPDPITFGKMPGAGKFHAAREAESAKPAHIPARKPVLQPKPEPVKAAPKAPARPAVKAAEKPVVKAPAKAHVKVAEEHVSKAAARPQVKLAAKHWPKTPEEAAGETPTNALVKVGAPKAPIEVGPGLDLMGSAVLEDGTTIYLVMQPGTSGMLNSSRLVSQLFSAKGPKPGFVINRFDAGAAEQPAAAGAAAGHRAHVAPPAAEETVPEKQEKKGGFSLKGFGRSIWSKLATPERTPSMTRLGLGADPGHPVTQPEKTESPAYSSPASTPLHPAEHAGLTPAESAHHAHAAGAHHPAAHAAASSHHHEPQTRIYRGATYVRGEDGQWHLQHSEAKLVQHEVTPIPLSSSTPIASATQMHAASRAESVEVAHAKARKPAVKAKPAPKTAKKKAVARKKPARPAAKPVAKAAAKSVSKPPAKKAAAKPAAKAPAKPASKPAAKIAAKLTVKAPAKTASKPKPKAKAPAAKLAPAKKKPVAASKAKPVKKTPAPKLPVNLPAAEPKPQEPPREPVAIAPTPEQVKES